MLGCVRHKLYIVIGNDCQVMAIDGEKLGCGRSRIDQPESVLFAMLEPELCEGCVVRASLTIVGQSAAVVSFTIDQIAVCELAPVANIEVIRFIRCWCDALDYGYLAVPLTINDTTCDPRCSTIVR